MKKQWKQIYQHYIRRLSFRWVLVCMLIILPINVLAVVYSSALYGKYAEKNRADHTLQTAAFADDLSYEMARISQALTYYFSTDSFGRILVNPTQDPSVLAVSCKNIISHIQDQNSAGFGYAWDHTNDILYIFQNNAHYSGSVQKAFEGWIRQHTLPMPFTQTQEICAFDQYVFLGMTHHFQRFSIGIYMDAGIRLENFYAYAIEPKGTMGFTDMQGTWLAAFQNGAWDLSPETEQIKKSGLFICQPLEFGHYSFFEYLETQQEYSFAGHLPLLFWALVILTLLGFAALPLIFKMSDKLLISPVSRLLEAMDQLGQGNMKIRLPEKANTADVEFMNRGFNRMAEEIHSLRIKTYEQEIEKLKTEAINLKLQVNPHMYLNALNTIYSLGRVGKTKEICDFTVLLMQYFRYSFRSDAEFSTVKDEIDFVTSYMKIQGMRFPGIFSFSFGLDPSVENTMIPRFIIENFAENTVKYALQSEKETEIIIQVRAQDNRLFISIVDDGCGMDEATLKTIQSGEVLEDNSGRHTGIWNSRRRLDFYYGKDYELSITSSLGKGTQVYLSLPMKMPNKADEPLRY